MQDLIHEEDIPYEQDILRNPDQFDAWWRYLQFKSSRPLKEQAFVFERAGQALGRSYKIWKTYLDIRSSNARKLQVSEEYDNTYAAYERALVMLNKMPLIWSDYLQLILSRRTSFVSGDITKIRTTFDRALQALPSTQHHRIWPLYLEFADKCQCPRTAAHIWSRYVTFSPSEKETCIEKLIDAELYPQAVNMLIEILNDGSFVSQKERSRFQIWEDLVETLVHHYSTAMAVDPEKVIRSGIMRFPDQCGKLWVQLATYWINRGLLEKARDVFEEGMERALTIRDFTQVFDSYVEFQESLISNLMEETDNGQDIELERQMSIFEQLMNRRPFFINDVLLRQDPNDVYEWQKRVQLWGDDVHRVVDTYNEAITTINPKKTKGKLHELWSDFAKFYEEHGNDLVTARTIYEKATNVPFKSVNELADIWIDWAEMELRHDNFDKAVSIMKSATTGPVKSNIDFFDESKPPQERLHKSMKVWSFYIDLVESVGTLDEVKPLYDRVFQLKIATTLTFVNYAQLLEENNYFEEAFKVYERGIEVFSYPVAFEIWNIYLQKAVARQLSVERLRDLFEQALEQCPNNLSKPIFIMYGKLEEDRGLIRNAIKIYDRAAHRVSKKDKYEMYKYYIARVAENFGLPATRKIFQDAVDNLDPEPANVVAQEFIEVEMNLGEIDRVRALYGYTAQFNDPEDPKTEQFWKKWHEFELANGSESTYKEMLRIKRSVKESFKFDLKAVARKQAAGNSDVIGFVASGEVLNATSDDDNDKGVAPTEELDQAQNPDEIDI